MLRHDATKVTLTEATVGQDRKVVLSILSRQVIPLETMFPMTPTRGALSIASYEASSTARGFSLGATHEILYVGGIEYSRKPVLQDFA